VHFGNAFLPGAPSWGISFNRTDSTVDTFREEDADSAGGRRTQAERVGPSVEV